MIDVTMRPDCRDVPWTPEEDEYIRANYRRIKLPALAHHLRRGQKQVSYRARKLNVVKRIPPPVTTREVQAALDAASKLTGVPTKQIMGVGRSRPLARARWLVIAVLSDRGHNMTQIGESIGLDHTSVLYALRRRETVDHLVPQAVAMTEELCVAGRAAWKLAAAQAAASIEGAL